MNHRKLFSRHFMTYVFGCIKIPKRDKLLLSKHGLNTKLKIPQKLFQLSQFFKYGKKINLHKYIQKMFPTSVLGTTQPQFENILKPKITESFSSSVWKTQVVIHFSLRGLNLLQILLFNPFQSLLNNFKMRQGYTKNESSLQCGRNILKSPKSERWTSSLTKK